VHREAERHAALGRHILLIGHADHPEVVGTMGQLPTGAVTLVQSVEEALTVSVANPAKLAYITQTTLSADDMAEIVGALRRRFPAIQGPKKDDICYATTNRQQAVKAIAGRCQVLLVLGAPNSSNSVRLVEVAKAAGCPEAFLVQRAAEIDWAKLAGVERLGITAGASAPELLVDEVIESARARFAVAVEEVAVIAENVQFKLPKALTA
jgi:4-hydroxy-3-methylbut-2-enyl diphosphate reductase